MLQQRIKATLQHLEKLRIKTELLLRKLKLIGKVLITKFQPVPFGYAGLLGLIQQCLSMAEELSLSQYLEKFGFWTWYQECFEIIIDNFKLQDNLQESLLYLGYLINGLRFIVNDLVNTITRLYSRFKPST